MLKVFLVEDERVIREGLRDNIPWEQYGYRFIGEASDGEMALPMIRKLKPDVLITDIKMPFMDGLSLSEMVKEEFPRTKIIIISGYDDFEYARRAIVAGVDQYLLKPITRAALRNVLLEIKEKIEQDMEQKDYQTRFQDEMQEFEQFSLRRFFEKILDGKLSVKEIYEEAAKLSLQIDAPCYNLLLFSFYEKENQTSGTDQNFFLRRQDEIFHYFLRHPQYILFRLNVNSYGVLIKSEEAQMEKLAEKVNVTRQTISNWELGETSPNPEQLILLSIALDKSIDELVGNDMTHRLNEKCGDNTKSIKKIYTGLAFLCGTIAGIWSFSANRFRYDEMILLIGAGMIIGLCLAVVCHNILNYLRNSSD